MDHDAMCDAIDSLRTLREAASRNPDMSDDARREFQFGARQTHGGAHTGCAAPSASMTPRQT
jgi:hypothetical protein